MTLDEIGTRLEAARGRIDRIYCHWTGAPYQLVECLVYHVVLDRGGVDEFREEEGRADQKQKEDSRRVG